MMNLQNNITNFSPMINGRGPSMVKDISLNKKNEAESFLNILSKMAGKTQETSSSQDSINRKDKEDKRLKKVSNEVESIFVNMLFKEMRKSLGKQSLIHGGMAEEIFQDMLYSEYSKVVAKTTKLGLAEMLYDQLKSK